jgi:hypothetical protein
MSRLRERDFPTIRLLVTTITDAVTEGVVLPPAPIEARGGRS